MPELEAIKSLVLPKEIKEGWGITHIDNYKDTNRTYFIISDVSSNLYLVDPNDFSLFETIGPVSLPTLLVNIFKDNL